MSTSTRGQQGRGIAPLGAAQSAMPAAGGGYRPGVSAGGDSASDWSDLVRQATHTASATSSATASLAASNEHDRAPSLAGAWMSAPCGDGGQEDITGTAGSAESGFCEESGHDDDSDDDLGFAGLSLEQLAIRC